MLCARWRLMPRIPLIHSFPTHGSLRLLLYTSLPPRSRERNASNLRVRTTSYYCGEAQTASWLRLVPDCRTNRVVCSMHVLLRARIRSGYLNLEYQHIFPPPLMLRCPTELAPAYSASYIAADQSNVTYVMLDGCKIRTKGQYSLTLLI